MVAQGNRIEAAEVTSQAETKPDLEAAERWVAYTRQRDHKTAHEHIHRIFPRA